MKKNRCQGSPGGTVEKNLPANAGDMGSIPGPAGSHMPQSKKACVLQLLSLCSRAQEPQLPKPKCPRARASEQERPPQGETHTWQLESSPYSPQLEKICPAVKTQHGQK